MDGATGVEDSACVVGAPDAPVQKSGAVVLACVVLVEPGELALGVGAPDAPVQIAGADLLACVILVLDVRVDAADESDEFALVCAPDAPGRKACVQVRRPRRRSRGAR